MERKFEAVRLKKNLFYGILSQIITVVLGIIIPRITLLGYGSDVNGLLNSVNQIIVYLSLFEAGVQMVALQSLYSPVAHNDVSSINSILSAVNVNYKKTGVCYLVCLIVLALIYPCIIRDNTIHYFKVFAVVLFLGIPNVILFLFQGKYKILLSAEGKGYILNIINTIITISNSIIKIILLYIGWDFVIVIFLNFIVSISQVCVYYVYIKKRYQWINLKVPPNFTALNQRNSAIIHQIAGMVFQNTDVLLLTIFCGLKVVSVYSLYKLVVTHVYSLLLTVFDSFGFALGQLYSKDKERFIKIIDVVDVFYGAFIFAVYNVMLYFILPFIKLYTEGVYDIVYIDNMLPILFFGTEILNVMRIPMLKTINYAGHFKNTLPQAIIETSINIVVSVVCVISFGIYGVLCGTIVALLYRTLEIIYYTNRKILNRSPFKTYVIYFTFFLLTLVFQSIIKLLNISIDSYGEFIIWGIVISLCTIICFLFISCLIFRKEAKIVIRLTKRYILKIQKNHY